LEAVPPLFQQVRANILAPGNSYRVLLNLVGSPRQRCLANTKGVVCSRDVEDSAESFWAQRVIAPVNDARIERDGFGNTTAGIASKTAPNIQLRIRAEIVACGSTVPEIGHSNLLPAPYPSKAHHHRQRNRLEVTSNAPFQPIRLRLPHRFQLAT
jgi:hypothetical protein